MPFTLAHPLLPVLIKKAVPRLSLTALIAGSMIPDMENFSNYKRRNHWHTVWLACSYSIGLLRCCSVLYFIFYYGILLLPTSLIITGSDWLH